MTEIAAFLDKVSNGECGLITSIMEVPISPDEPDFHIYVANFQDPMALQTNPRRRIPKSSRVAAGAGLTSTSAMWATLGEAVERYSSSNWAHLNIVEATASEIPGGVELLERLILFSPEFYANPDAPYFPADTTVPRTWIRGVRLTDEQEVDVPAPICLLNYVATHEHEVLDRTYSTGVACHSDGLRALYSALCEVVERDAYASFWLTQTRPSRLSDDVLRELTEERLYEGMCESPFRFAVCPLPTDIGVPVFCTMATIPGGGVASGAACRLDVAEALNKSILECMHTANWCLQMRRSDYAPATLQAEDLQQFVDHVRYYLPEERTAIFPWKPQELDELEALPSTWLHDQVAEPDPLQAIVSKVVAAGFQPIGVDLTSPDIRSLGMQVRRVLIPGMQPLYAGYENVHTDVRRLNSFLRERGGKRDPCTADDVLACPLHAFP